jgi:hypothetical protein
VLIIGNSITLHGPKESMKAIGLFEHEGVAAHPGDLGMRQIAGRIWEALRPSLDFLEG